jgi:hypothetical protein
MFAWENLRSQELYLIATLDVTRGACLPAHITGANYIAVARSAPRKDPKKDGRCDDVIVDQVSHKRRLRKYSGVYAM